MPRFIHAYIIVTAFMAVFLAWTTSVYAATIDPHTAGVPVGTNLVRQDGTVTLQAGQTLEGKDLHGCVVVMGDGATIRNSRISDCADSAGNIRVNASNVTIENVESFKSGATGFVVFVGYCADTCNGVGSVRYIHDVVFRHNLIYGGGDNMIVTGVNTITIEGNHMHDPVTSNASHTDVLQFTASNHVIIRNNILINGVGVTNGGTFVGAPFVKADFDNMDDILIEHNESSGGTAAIQCYGMHADNDYNGTPYGPPTNCVIKNNVLHHVAYTNPHGAPILMNPAQGSTTSCNTFEDKATPVTITSGDSPRASMYTDHVDSTCTPGPQADGIVTTSTPVPTGGTSNTCPATKPYGDADCDGAYKLVDYGLWLLEFKGSSNTQNADFNSSHSVTLTDYEIWRRTYINGGPPSSSPSTSPSTGPSATMTPPSPTPTTAVSTGFPDATNTGPHTIPTRVWSQSAGPGGQITVTEDIDGYVINGCVKTGRAGVKITNSVINGSCSVSILTDEGSGGDFEYNNITDVGHGGASTIGCGFNSKFVRNNATGGADGVKEGTGCQVLENYIHDLDEYVVTGGGTHNDGVQIESGQTTGMMIRGNTFANTCGKSGIAGQGCAGTLFFNNGAHGNTVDANYIARWDGPTAGFVFHMINAGANTITNNVLQCDKIAGFGIYTGGSGTFTNNNCK